MTPLSDVFTVDEIARAAGVPRWTVQQLIDSGDLSPVGGSRFFPVSEAVLAGRKARSGVAAAPLRQFLYPAAQAREERGLSAAASSLVHAVFLAVLIWSASSPAETAPVRAQPQTRLVFLAGAGPGGGGGGGGRAPRADVRRIAKPRPRPSEMTVLDPERLPSRLLVSPVAVSSGEDVRQAREEDGVGPAEAAGLGPGTGGGSGGGPFRPGSGVDPPRLLHEVKAEYTDAARRQGVTGEVILEVVIAADGTVTDVQVLRGLGHGLDERAASAVADWRFAPARRFGEPVSVIVEVAVEFSLR